MIKRNTMSVIYRVFYENYKVCLKRSVNGIRKQQKTRFKQTKFIGLQNNRHPSQHTFGNVRKPSGNCQQRPL